MKLSYSEIIYITCNYKGTQMADHSFGNSMDSEYFVIIVS